jgi:exopolysaccharide production protein ExoZ
MRFNSIQLLRGIAALYVFLFHINNVFYEGTASGAGYLFSKGYTGVDIFFVISGFVISLSISKATSSKDLFKFLIDRLIRIYPTYWFIASVFLLFGACHASYDSSYIIKSYLLIPSYELLCTVQSWTLCYELYFYLLASLLIISKKFRYIFFLLGTCSILSAVMPYFSLNVHLPERSFYGVHFMEFALGMIAFRYHHKLSAKAGFLLIAAALLIHIFPFQEGQLYRLLQIAIPSFFIIIGVTAIEVKRKITIPKILLLTGNSSYVLYLINTGLCYILVEFMPLFAGYKLPVLFIFAVLTTGLSVVLHYYLEAPVIRFLKLRLTLKNERIPQKV